MSEQQAGEGIPTAGVGPKPEDLEENALTPEEEAETRASEEAEQGVAEEDRPDEGAE